MALLPDPPRLNGAGETASDESLVARAVALGDTVAFEALMRRHQRRIYHLLVRFTRRPALAEELCQETFVRAWRKLGSFAGRGRFAAWLSRLAYNVFLQHLRRHPQDAVTRALDDAPAAAADPATEDTAAQGPELERLLAVVNAEERRVLILAYAGGLSATEIGAMLSMPPGTVKSHIHRAKAKIRQHLRIGDEP